MTILPITFESSDGKELLLQGVIYDIQIDGLMAKTTIIQQYNNPYDTNIEAVYTFPLSSNAVLLGVEITINDRVLKGTILEKNSAESQYEKAIDEGNRAIMLEKNSDGLYTVNIANLLAKDKISIAIEYTQLLEWRQDQIKWSLPTTVAPKYGNPSDLNLDDVTDPSISLLAENQFNFRMNITGVLADSNIDAPSHKICVEREEDFTEVYFENETDFMDKDIVFTFKTHKSREDRSFTLVGKDFDGYAAIASFYPSFGNDLPRQSKSVTFVIDCSGSMMGASIQSAKIALSKALELFCEEDLFNIIKFGTHHEKLFDKEVPANLENINIAKHMIHSIDANMGGTEMQSALQSAYDGHFISQNHQAYLFLITDGQIYNHADVITQAIKSEMSHYVVGVGYASDDPLLKKIANKTKGSYENVDPNEKMDNYILNIFKKIDLPKAVDIKVNWSSKVKVSHIPEILFDGDTLYAYATFDEKPKGEVTLEYILENNNKHTSKTAISSYYTEEEDASVVSKIVIAEEISSLNTVNPNRLRTYIDEDDENSKNIIGLSVKYQLFSELTNYILVDNIDEANKPINLPQMHFVDNMELNYSRSRSYDQKENLRMSMRCTMEDYLDIPSYISSYIESDEYLFDINTKDAKRYLLLFDEWFINYNRLPRRLSELKLIGLDEDILTQFKTLDFRKKIRILVLYLYQNNKDLEISEKLVKYLENMS